MYEHINYQCTYNVYVYTHTDTRAVHVRKMDDSRYIVWYIATQHCYVPLFKRFIMCTIYMIVVNKWEAIREKGEIIHDETCLYIQIEKNVSISIETLICNFNFNLLFFCCIKFLPRSYLFNCWLNIHVSWIY